MRKRRRLTMAKSTTNIAFKNCQISLAENAIYEFQKEEVVTYVLSDVLRKFEGDNRMVNLTIQETSELEMPNEEGE